MPWPWLALTIAIVAAVAATQMVRRARRRAEAAEHEVIRLQRERDALTRRVG